ncbi:MAG: WG repeat-containing protein [Sphingobacteriales bacterium]|nr:MAG: WG repeat-containing protein [Sphingobacteriales bacterium]
MNNILTISKAMFKRILIASLLTFYLTSVAQNEQTILLAPVKDNGKWGYINDSGKFIVFPKFEFANEFTEGLAAVKVNGLWGFINGNGKYVIEPKFDDAYNYSENIARVKQNGQWGYIDKQGRYLTQHNYELAGDFSDGLAPVLLGGKFGYINSKGEYVLEPQFDDAYDFSEGVALVSLNGQWGYIDMSGNFVELPPSEDLSNFISEGMAVVRSNGKYGYLNTKGQFAIAPQFEDARHFSESLAAVAKNRKYGYIDSNGNFGINPVFEDADYFTERLAAVRFNGYYGYINTAGTFVIVPQFEDAKPFAEGLAKVRFEGRYGFINNRGEFVVAPEYKWANDFSEGLASVEWNGNFGYISSLGWTIIEPQFEEAGSFKKVQIINSTNKPQITIEAPLDAVTTVEQPEITVKALISSSTQLADYLLVINNQLQDLQPGIKGTSIKKISKSDTENHDVLVETTINLQPGLNEFYLRAVNNNGSTNSETKKVLYYSSEMAEKPNLYILTVGIAKYQQSQYNINYADADANDFANAFYLQSKMPEYERLYKNIVIEKLINEDATTQNIKKAIYSMRKMAVKGDLFVLHISSHGEIDTQGDFYIRTYDADAGLDYLSISALSNKWLAEQIRQFDCTVVQLFDACHSGSGSSDLVNDGLALKGSESTDIAVRELKDALQSKALYFFASSSRMQMSQERKEWENGAFTEAVLNCFNQKPYTTFNGQPIIADLNGDGFINTSELNDYISKVVKVITNGQQTPKATIENGETINLFVLDKK